MPDPTPFTLSLHDDEQVPVIIMGTDDVGQPTGDTGEVPTLSFDSDVCVPGTAKDGAHAAIASNKKLGTCNATITLKDGTVITGAVTVVASAAVAEGISFGTPEKIV